MICSKKAFCASEEWLHLPDVGHLGIDELLGQIFDLGVMLLPMVHVFQTFHHAPGIANDHHVRNFGVGASVAQLHAAHHVRHNSCGLAQFWQFPAMVGGQGMGLAFDSIVLLKLGFQGFLQVRFYGCIHNTADAHLAHLRCFQNGGKNFLIGFHVHHPYQDAQNGNIDTWAP